MSAVSAGCGPSEAETEADEPGSVTGAAWGCKMEPSNSVGCWYFTCNSDTSYADACAGALQAGTDYCASQGGVDSRSRLCVMNNNPLPYQGSYLFCCGSGSM